MVTGFITAFVLMAFLGAVSCRAQEIRVPDLQGDDSAANVIFRLEDGAMEKWRRGDPMGWIDISADDVSYIDPGLTEPVVGIEAYRKYLEPLAGKILYDGSEYVKPRVALFGSVAVLTYNYHSLSRDPAGGLKRSSFWNTTEVYRLIAGKWRIVHTHWSFIGHHPPAVPDFAVPVFVPGEKMPSGVPADLLARETAAMERWRKGDPGGFIALCIPDATCFDRATKGRLNGLGEIRAFYQESGKTAAFDAVEFLKPRVQFYGDAAVLTYRFLATALNPDGSVKYRVPWQCSEVYARLGGEWKIIHTHWSNIQGERY